MIGSETSVRVEALITCDGYASVREKKARTRMRPKARIQGP